MAITLYNLAKDAAAFLDIPVTWPDRKKLTFQFFIDDQERVILKGWLNRMGSDDYDDNPTPSIELTPITPSNLAVGQGLFIGNQVFYRKDIEKLIKSLRQTGDKSVLFTLKVGTNELTNRLLFDISTSTKEVKDLRLSDFQNLVTVVTSTNPSPPKNSSGS